MSSPETTREFKYSHLIWALNYVLICAALDPRLISWLLKLVGVGTAKSRAWHLTITQVINQVFFINEPKIIYLDLIIIYLCGPNCRPELEGTKNQNQIREPLIGPSQTQSDTSPDPVSLSVVVSFWWEQRHQVNSPDSGDPECCTRSILSLSLVTVMFHSEHCVRPLD